MRPYLKRENNSKQNRKEGRGVRGRFKQLRGCAWHREVKPGVPCRAPRNHRVRPKVFQQLKFGSCQALRWSSQNPYIIKHGCKVLVAGVYEEGIKSWGLFPHKWDDCLYRKENWRVVGYPFCHAICSKGGGPSEAQSYSSADQESSGSTSLRFHSLEKISIQSFPKKITQIYIYRLENKLP